MVSVANMSGRTSSRRVAAKSVRTSQRQVAKPLVSKKVCICGGVMLVLIVVAAVGYKPFITSQLVKGLAAGDAAAAKELWNYRKEDAPEIAIGAFTAHLKDQTDTKVLEAVVAGLSLALIDGSKDALDLAKDVFKAGAVPERETLAKVVPDVAAAFLDKSLDKDKAVHEQAIKNMEALAPALVERVKAKDESVNVRLAAIKALGKMPCTGGGCQALLEVAKSEKGVTRTEALQGIPRCAVPEAVGDLLKYMADQDDEGLSGVAQQGFAKVRNEAKVGELTPLLDHPSDLVRLEIIKALADRKGDAAAAKGIAKALGDKNKDLRLEAVKAVPAMALKADDLNKLEPLVCDSSEDVRIAAAETLSKLQDEITWKLLLQSFEKGFVGKTLEAYVKALGLRGKLRSSKSSGAKDLSAIAIVLDSMNKFPDRAATIGEAMVLLTTWAGRPQRETERRGWKLETWNTWYANLKARGVLEKEAMEILKTADKGKADIDKYPQLMKQTDKAIEMLELGQKMCIPNDPEDDGVFVRAIENATKMRMLFFKSQHL